MELIPRGNKQLLMLDGWMDMFIANQRSLPVMYFGVIAQKEEKRGPVTQRSRLWIVLYTDGYIITYTCRARSRKCAILRCSSRKVRHFRIFSRKVQAFICKIYFYCIPKKPQNLAHRSKPENFLRLGVPDPVTVTKIRDAMMRPAHNTTQKEIFWIVLSPGTERRHLEAKYQTQATIWKWFAASPTSKRSTIYYPANILYHYR